MRLVNLTPHTFVLLTSEGERVEIPPSGTVCRAEEIVKVIGHIDVNGVGRIPIRRVEYGAPVGLPDPEPGVGYLVSVIAAQAIRRHCPHRTDVFVSSDPVRDETGRIIGCRALAVV